MFAFGLVSKLLHLLLLLSPIQYALTSIQNGDLTGQRVALAQFVFLALVSSLEPTIDFLFDWVPLFRVLKSILITTALFSSTLPDHITQYIQPLLPIIADTLSRSRVVSQKHAASIVNRAQPRVLQFINRLFELSGLANFIDGRRKSLHPHPEVVPEPVAHVISPRRNSSAIIPPGTEQPEAVEEETESMWSISVRKRRRPSLSQS